MCLQCQDDAEVASEAAARAAEDAWEAEQEQSADGGVLRRLRRAF